MESIDMNKQMSLQFEDRQKKIIIFREEKKSLQQEKNKDVIKNV